MNRPADAMLAVNVMCYRYLESADKLAIRRVHAASIIRLVESTDKRYHRNEHEQNQH
jgi:hypothetical protein